MKPNIALITGGYSSESSVSYLSFKNILKNIDKKKFNLFQINITLAEWVCVEGNKKFVVDKNDFSVIINRVKIKFDLCYIIIHGTPGEDGKLQSYFELINQKYISCNSGVSALTFNKFYTTSVLRALNVNVANSILLVKGQAYDIKKIITHFNFPVFVKPNNGGSSIGIGKVKKQEELADAIKRAFIEDSQVIIEEQIEGQEFTVGVYKLKNKLTILPITEIKSHNDFFDFDAKYNGQSLEITPARINASLKHAIEVLATTIYQKLNCSALIRIDVIYNASQKKLFVLEINTVPGQTESSFIPQQIVASKQSLKKFYTLLFSSYL